MKYNSEDKIIHSTDLSFVSYCEQRFGINRGIYNTIEAWFYQNGLVEIIQRRKTMIQFLRFATGDHQGDRKFHFGHRGLVPKLKDFMKAHSSAALY